MIDFLVVGFPRSGTTWIANWLTTERSLCLHEPFASMTLEDVSNQFHPTKRIGVADTGLWYRPDICQQLARRTAVIHRSRADIQKSLKEIGMPELAFSDGKLWDVPGFHFDFADLFDTVRVGDLHEYLLPGIDYDPERHAILKDMIINPNLNSVRLDASRARAFLKEVVGGMPCQ